MSAVQTLPVDPEEAELRLDRWFRRRYPHITQGALQKLCRTGQIRVDGKRAEAATRLEAGQQIRIPPLPPGPPPKDERPVDPRLRRELDGWRLYEDEHVIVIDKPPGLATQGGPGITRHLDGMLDAWRPPGGHRPRLVHRLDRDTSGVLLLARTPAAAGKLAHSFRGRDMHKTYWAVTVGRPVPSEGRIDLPLVKLGAGRGSISAPAERDDEEAASALTDYRTLDAAGKKLAWLELTPLTGRTHQLRAHCEALGTPILGDDKYGGERSMMDGLPAQLHLHARSLLLPHPAGGTLEVSAPLPPHMRETFRQLGFDAPATPGPRRA